MSNDSPVTNAGYIGNPMRFIVSFGFCLLLISICLGQTRRQAGRSARVAPGDFDYYVLSLSWAPDYCDNPNVQHDPKECGTGRRVGFVVHGLWPQQDNGGHPSQCAAASPVAQDIVQQILGIIPTESLIQHEWRDHGTCSGLSAAAYFDLVRRAYQKVAIPSDLKQLSQTLNTSPAEMDGKFASANPQFRGSFRTACSGGELTEVRMCMAKDLSPRACSASDRDCTAATMTMLPVR
jgi:ribonuclease T2